MNKSLCRRWILLGVLALCAARAAGQETPRNTKFPQQILLIRHSEKTGDPDDVHLSDAGKERAKLLSKLFKKTDKGPAPFAAPDFIIAAHDARDSQRPRETVVPLAAELKLTIDDRFYSSMKDKPGRKGAAELSQELLTDPKYAGKTILISWRHSKLPGLAKMLKAENVPEEWGAEVYDRVWQITYDNNGKTTFADRPQRLMPKDDEK